MPVNHRRLGQPVREFDLQRDALLRFQDGTGNLPVESVAADFAAGSNLPIDFTRLQAVDGVANKQADIAWVSAPAAEKAAFFASAEAVRWIEWGMRSYHEFALGLALLLFAVAVVRTAWVPRPIGYLMGLSGLTCLVQGWVVGAFGFSQTESIAIVVTWVLSLAWMIWLVVVAWRMQDVGAPSPADEGRGRPDAIHMSSR